MAAPTTIAVVVRMILGKSGIRKPVALYMGLSKTFMVCKWVWCCVESRVGWWLCVDVNGMDGRERVIVMLNVPYMHAQRFADHPERSCSNEPCRISLLIKPSEQSSSSHL